ncbi:MAG: hypothetical protein JO115_22170 [Pseudonocardiales bacterium]|nr:hypothetical protein [Pseudonocardiales bacterium]
MAYTFWGIGTTFYGRAAFRADGSYLMTEFVTILYCPLIPLRSLRAATIGQRSTGVPLLFWSSRTDYSILETCRPDARQCLRVYALTLGVLLGPALLNPLIPFPFSLVVTGVVASVVTAFLRNRARHRTALIKSFQRGSPKQM